MNFATFNQIDNDLLASLEHRFTYVTSIEDDTARIEATMVLLDDTIEFIASTESITSAITNFFAKIFVALLDLLVLPFKRIGAVASYAFGDSKILNKRLRNQLNMRGLSYKRLINSDYSKVRNTDIIYPIFKKDTVKSTNELSSMLTSLNIMERFERIEKYLEALVDDINEKNHRGVINTSAQVIASIPKDVRKNTEAALKKLIMTTPPANVIKFGKVFNSLTDLDTVVKTTLSMDNCLDHAIKLDRENKEFVAIQREIIDSLEVYVVNLDKASAKKALYAIRDMFVAIGDLLMSFGMLAFEFTKLENTMTKTISKLIR